MSRLRGVEQLEFRTLLALEPQLAVDFDVDPSEMFEAEKLVPLDDGLYFSAVTPTTGRELWRSDGTNAGTRRVRDINPGEASGFVRNSPMIEFRDQLYFLADDGEHGVELWRTDGSEAGTQLVRDINPGEASSFVGSDFSSGQFSVLDDQLFFRADDGQRGRELWKTDGTSAGTTIVKDIVPGIGGAAPSELTIVDNTIYFSAIHASYGVELWKSDGTEVGTQLVKEIRPGRGIVGPESLTAFQGQLYFTADADDGAGRSLWRSDGTFDGTERVTQRGGVAESMFPVENQLFFLSPANATGRELWTTDGTDDGTRIVRDINPGRNNAFSYWESLRMFPFEDRHYFVADDSEFERQLWSTDGTLQGTQREDAVRPSADRRFVSGVTLLLSSDDGLYFSAGNENRRALWHTDGTTAGTIQLSDDVHRFDAPSNVVEWNQTIYFLMDDETGGRQLWSSNGQLGGSQPVRTSWGNEPSDPKPIGTLNDALILTTTEREINDSGSQSRSDLLWSIDTATQEPKQLGRFSQIRDGAVLLGEHIYFAAGESTYGTELWRTDGTVQGTRLVFDAHPDSSGAPEQLTVMNGALYFVARNASDRRLLFRSEGIGAAVVSPQPISPEEIVVVDDQLYFSAWTQDTGRELWTSDGTEVGTRLVSDLVEGIRWGRPSHLVSHHGQLVFAAFGEGVGLWRSDGTDQGTEVLLRLGGTSTADISDLISVGEQLYFVANDQRHGRELWRTDGTALGTRLVRDIHQGEASAFERPGVANFTALAGLLYFTADDGATGTELWRSDGTTAGTRRVSDIRPGPKSSAPSDLIAIGHRLYFAASDGDSGRELWESDGTANGTNGLGDIAPGPGSSRPTNLFHMPGAIYFAATDDVHGRELWMLDFDAIDDRNQDDTINEVDLDSICSEIRSGAEPPSAIESFWHRQRLGPGDVNLDRRFNSADLVLAFQADRYNNGKPATWRTGDWNCDGVFDSQDLVLALQLNRYDPS